MRKILWVINGGVFTMLVEKGVRVRMWGVSVKGVEGVFMGTNN